jgi:hypothetical protein
MTNQNPVEINPYGRAFKGTGIIVEMAIFTEKNESGLNDVLLKITGTDAYSEGIDGKVLRYRAVHAGIGVDFQIDIDGKPITRMLSRDSSGNWGHCEVLIGNRSHHVYLDEELSKQVLPPFLLNTYKCGNSGLATDPEIPTNLFDTAEESEESDQ